MTMIKKLAVLATATAAFAATPAMAQDSNSDGTASVNIVAPLSLANTASLDFGTIVLPTVATTGTVIVDSAGLRTCPAGFTCTAAGTSAAAYTLTATENVGVTITVPDTVSIANGNGDNLTVDLLPESGVLGSDATQTGNDFALTMPDNPTGSSSVYAFSFGGSIALADTTPDGAYSGTITVDADYQ